MFDLMYLTIAKLKVVMAMKMFLMRTKIMKEVKTFAMMPTMLARFVMLTMVMVTTVMALLTILVVMTVMMLLTLLTVVTLLVKSTVSVALVLLQDFPAKVLLKPLSTGFN
jgi:hypothetical protein